ncbi:hypothetical protein M5K25_001877 [Dendrobium thyrsiflorum]|uniref:DUF4283 domain-containing protein n=1 Tax=Dendrobium thyrsiflorum TaxID=117978 RepID=A0ABD0VRK4_DENTH
MKLSLGDARAYYLSTAKNELGVVSAQSIAGFSFLRSFGRVARGRALLPMETAPSDAIHAAWGVPPSAPSTKGLLVNEGLVSSTRSFREVLAGPSSSKEPNFSFKKSTVRGVPAILMSDDDILKLASPFQYTLVGKFLVRRPNLDAIRLFFGKLKLSGLLDARHVSIQLSNDLDYSRVFARRSYYILNCQMRLLKWTPFFDVKEESPIVPIWISFPNLRLHFFNSYVLHALGSIFGRPLQTDQATASRSRPSVARVLVEVDITKKHPKDVWLGSENSGYLQKVEFENVPDFCVHCKIHGHSINNCFVAHPQLRKTNMISKPVTDCNDVEPVVAGELEPLTVNVFKAVEDGIEKDSLVSPLRSEDQRVENGITSDFTTNIENVNAQATLNFGGDGDDGRDKTDVGFNSIDSLQAKELEANRRSSLGDPQGGDITLGFEKECENVQGINRQVNEEDNNMDLEDGEVRPFDSSTSMCSCRPFLQLLRAIAGRKSL